MKAKYCAACGKKLPISDEISYCPYCGTALHNNENRLSDAADGHDDRKDIIIYILCFGTIILLCAIAALI